MLIPALLLLVMFAPAVVSAVQDAPVDVAVRRHVRAIEGATGGTLDEALARFERDHFSRGYLARVSPADRRDVMTAVRTAAADVDDVRVMRRDGRFVVVLGGRVAHEVTFTVEAGEPFGIDTLEVTRSAATTVPAAALDITRENLDATFDRLEKDGWSGVVSVRLDGKVALERPFGLGNPSLGLPMRLDTIFGTGSRPIDYTIAAIFLLEQDGKLGLDDTIDRFFGADVPPDKRSMTIRHLMNGQSGLPDFFHTADDRDPDLAWIDRITAERRILAQPLRFAPGTGRAHSHAAFGLLAAIVERASGQSYAAFVRQRLLGPAGMTRTGFYGESLGLAVTDFAVGGGPDSVGVPNIPPKWGPASWLVMGSGGMFSTLGDLQRFYTFVRSGPVLADRHAARFRGPFATLDGSDRGFELFHVHNPVGGSEVILLLNMPLGRPGVRQVFDALARLVQPGARPN
jgi:CubicO group peptidase (beta-lactamase class C family)